MSKRFSLITYVASAAAMGLAACQSSAPTRLYTLTPTRSVVAAPSAYAGPPVQVRAVHVPPDLDRTEFLRESAPGQWSVLEQDQWAAPLSRLIRQTLTEDLASRMPAGAVLFPNAPARADGVGIAIDILSLRFSQGQATLQVGWSLSPPSPSAHAAQLTLTTSAGNASALETSRALSQLLGQLADRLAADLST